MAFSGGTYTLPAGNPVVTGTTISSSWANTTLSDIATALSTCVLKDGTQTLTANIPMAGFKLTGLAAGSSAADSVRLSQLQGNSASYLTGTAGTNTITASGTPAVTALATGQRFTFIPANTNTAATTLQVDSTSALSIFWNNVALTGGELRQNVPVTVLYDGTQYQLISSGAMANTFAIPDTMRVQSINDRTKQITFNVSGVSTATTRTVSMPDSDVTLPIINLNATRTAGTFLAGPASGAAAIPSFRTLSGSDGASMVLVGAKTATNQATLDFTNSDFDWTAYDAYEFLLVSVRPTTDAQNLGVRLAVSASAVFDSGSSYQYANTALGMNGTTYDLASTSDTATYPGVSVQGVSNNSANTGMDLSIRIFKPTGTAGRKRLAWWGTFGGSTSDVAIEGAGVGISANLSNNALTGIRFLFASGSIAAGSFYAYGIRST